MLKIKTSKLFRLNFYDIIKAALLAALTGAAGVTEQVIEIWLKSPEFSISHMDMVLITKAAAFGFFGSILKNFFSPAMHITPAEEKPAA